MDGSFNLAANVNIFNSTTVAHTTVHGTVSTASPVNWYSFTGRAGATVYLDVDQANSAFDAVLALFRSSGELIAYSDDSTSFPADPGSIGTLDSFIGSLLLTADDTCFLALSGRPKDPDFSGCTNVTRLTRPDAVQEGAYSLSGCTDRTFSMQGQVFGAGEYTLHLSNYDPVGVPLPLPGSAALLGLGMAALGWRQRRKLA